MTGPERPYVVIAGFGRSGSNLIEALLDLHPGSFCRNEPNELSGSAFAPLDAFFPDDLAPGFAQKWTAAVATEAARRGARDALPSKPWKNYRSGGPVARALARIEKKGRIRPFFGMRGETWQAPRSVYDPQALARALPVFKILLVPETIRAAHDADPAMRVIHILRPPEAFLASWYNRYVLGPGGGPEQVLEDNRATLPGILAHYGADPERCAEGGIGALVESELWRWRYVNERIGALEGDRYLRVGYRAAKDAAGETAVALARFAGLAPLPDLAERAERIENRLFASSHTERLPPEAVDRAIDAVLDGAQVTDWVRPA